MSGLWFAPLPLHSGLAGHNWFTQILVIMLIAGVWLFISGNIARRAANRRSANRRSPTRRQRPPRQAGPLRSPPSSALKRPT